MDQGKNFHEGHRERLINRFLQSSDGTPDHELLEILLFPMIPRKDTNLIAHKLLHTFGDLDKVFKADAKELMAVEGVGKRTACELVVIGKIINRINESKKPVKAKMRSFFDIKDIVVKDLSGLSEERFLLYLLDDKFNQMLRIDFEDHHRDSVTAKLPEVTTALALHRPKGVILAHNHPSGNAKPSRNDDVTTHKLIVMCSMFGAEILDHVIVSGTKTFSYYQQGRLDDLKRQIQNNVLFDKEFV